MCGLTGYVLRANTQTRIQAKRAIRRFQSLTLLARERGRDTGGVYILIRRRSDGEIIATRFKTDGDVSTIFQSIEYRNLRRVVQKGKYEVLLALSHTRMATACSTADPVQNQPLIGNNGMVIFFNGIVTDRSASTNLYQFSPQNDGWFLLDTSLAARSKELGMCNVIRFNEHAGTLEFFSNTGDLFSLKHGGGEYLSSDDRFLRANFASLEEVPPTHQVPKNVLVKSNLPRPNITENYDVKSYSAIVANRTSPKIDNALWADISAAVADRSKDVARCSKCLYPVVGNTDAAKSSGICAYCAKPDETYSKLGPSKEKEFALKLENAERENKPILLGLSGGRDSCFVLSELKETLGVSNLITYTFDWGVNTPYARNNVSKICAEFGVRNILVAADIRKKRRNVRAVVKAYCSNPVPALVPLLMAGDKQFISSAKAISNQLDSSLEVFGFNPLEKTRFKEELVASDLWPEDDEGLYGEDLSLRGQMRLAAGYGYTLLKNPAYWGLSLVDAAKGFLNYYQSGVTRTNYFDYFEWNELAVDAKLDSLGWQKNTGRSSWRIGDGTSAFYNLAYCLSLGWCENDTLRANQVRRGHIAAHTAEELIARDNSPNKEMMEWYFNMLELDGDRYLRRLLRAYV